MISKHFLSITFLSEAELIFFTQLNRFTYFYQIQIILFTIDYLFAYNLMFSVTAMYHLIIQLNISHLFKHSYMIKQFYFKQFNLA